MKTEAYKGVLSDYAFYAKEHIAVSSLDRDHYFSTENMIPNRGGVCRATSLPEQERAIRVEAGDVLISNIRPYFKKIWLAKELAGCSNDVLCIRAKSMCLPEFLFYYLSSDTFFDYVMAGTKGTKMPRGDKQQIMHFHVLIPNLDIQKQVISILSCIDEKIQLNAQINRNLEQQAQAIFKSWFVDFEPFRDGKFVDSELGPIPKGWRIGTLGDIASISSGKRPVKKSDSKNAEYIYPLVGASCVMGFTCDYLYERPIVVTGRVGTHGIIQYFNEKCWPSDNTLVIQGQYINLIHQFLQRIDFKSLNRGSTQPLITQIDIKRQLCPLAPENIIDDVEKILTSLRTLIQKRLQENQRLTQLRDTLLPKLMSGEIDVSEVEV